MAASTRELRLPARLPAWMIAWPVGVRPRAAYATREGVELLLVGADGRWALVRCRHTDATRSADAFDVRTVAIDETLAARARLVARAIEAALLREGQRASSWLRTLPERVACLERGADADGEALAPELLEIREILEIQGTQLDADALTELGMRTRAPAVAAAVLHRLIADGQLQPALAMWARWAPDIASARSPAMDAVAAMMHALIGDWTAALTHARRVAELAFDATTHRAAGALAIALREHDAGVEQLAARARLDDSVGAHEHLMAAAALAGDRRRVSEAAARARALGSTKLDAMVDAMLQAGAYEAAEALLRERAELEDSAEVLAALAQVLLRRAETSEADALAREALERAPELAAALVVRGGAAVLDGEHEAALVHLDRAIELEPSNQDALSWRVEAILKSDSERDAQHDLFAAPFEDTAVWQLLFALVRSRRDRAEGLHGPLAYFHRALLRDIHAPEVYEAALASDEDTLALLWATLARFGGSRSAPFSMVDDAGRLVSADAIASTQVQATRWQHRLLTRPADEVLAGFEQLAERYPDSPHPQTYAAELHLWLGNYETAWQLTDEMWTKTGTRWSYIGSGAALGLLGRFDEALERWEIGRRAFKTYLGHEATYCHRGEVYRLLGRLDEARADLEQATRASPTRVGAWINLGLVELESGDADALERALTHIDGLAPVLVWEATRAAGLEPATRVDRRQVETVLEHALRLMRGNRSSVMHTFVDDRGQLRVTPDELLETWRRVAASLESLLPYGLL